MNADGLAFAYHSGMLHGVHIGIGPCSCFWPMSTVETSLLERLGSNWSPAGLPASARKVSLKNEKQPRPKCKKVDFGSDIPQKVIENQLKSTKIHGFSMNSIDSVDYVACMDSMDCMDSMSIHGAQKIPNSMNSLDSMKSSR